MPWTLVGSPTFSAATGEAVAGPLVVPELGGLSVKVSAPVAVPDFPGHLWLYFRSAYGEELGRLEVQPQTEPIAYHLGEGLRVRDPEGVLVLEQGDWCRRWLMAGFALTVCVLADLPTPDPSGLVVPPGFAGPSGGDLLFTPTGDAARIAFPR